MDGGFLPLKLPHSLDWEDTGLEGTLLCLGLLLMSSQGLVFSSLQERGGQRLLWLVSACQYPESPEKGCPPLLCSGELSAEPLHLATVPTQHTRDTLPGEPGNTLWGEAGGEAGGGGVVVSRPGVTRARLHHRRVERLGGAPGEAGGRGQGQAVPNNLL